VLVILIINTLLCIAGIIGSFGLMMGAGYAQERRKGPLGEAVSCLSLLFPFVAAISAIGSWVAYFLGNDGVAIIFVVTPWILLLFLMAGNIFL